MAVASLSYGMEQYLLAIKAIEKLLAENDSHVFHLQFGLLAVAVTFLTIPTNANVLIFLP